MHGRTLPSVNVRTHGLSAETSTVSFNRDPLTCDDHFYKLESDMKVTTVISYSRYGIIICNKKNFILVTYLIPEKGKKEGQTSNSLGTMTLTFF